MEVKDDTSTLISQTTTPVDTLLVPYATFPSEQTILFDLPSLEMGTIHSNTETVEPLYFYHQQLAYTPTVLGCIG